MLHSEISALPEIHRSIDSSTTMTAYITKANSRERESEREWHDVYSRVFQYTSSDLSRPLNCTMTIVTCTHESYHNSYRKKKIEFCLKRQMENRKE